LEHLLREAGERMPDGGSIEVVGKRRGGGRSLEVRVQRGSDLSDAATISEGGSKRADRHANLRVILARLLLEVQGATLACETRGDGCWAAHIEFPARR
jgi:hypothetical protein